MLELQKKKLPYFLFMSLTNMKVQARKCIRVMNIFSEQRLMDV